MFAEAIYKIVSCFAHVDFAVVLFTVHSATKSKSLHHSRKHMTVSALSLIITKATQNKFSTKIHFSNGKNLSPRNQERFYFVSKCLFSFYYAPNNKIVNNQHFFDFPRVLIPES